MISPRKTRKGPEIQAIRSRVTALRRAYRISQAELARRAKVATSVLNELENGVTRDPRVSTILCLADALHVSPDYLFGIEPQRAHKSGMVAAVCIGCDRSLPNLIKVSSATAGK